MAYVWHLFFTFKGRISRNKYLIANLLLIIYYILEIAIPTLIMTEEIASSEWMYLLLLPPFVSGLALTTKRLHDRSRSAWWLLFYVALPVLIEAVSELNHYRYMEAARFATMVIGLCLIIDLGFRRGTTGPNRYGPDPRARTRGGDGESQTAVASQPGT